MPTANLYQKQLFRMTKATCIDAIAQIFNTKGYAKCLEEAPKVIDEHLKMFYHFVDTSELLNTLKQQLAEGLKRLEFRPLSGWKWFARICGFGIGLIVRFATVETAMYVTACSCLGGPVALGFWAVLLGLLAGEAIYQGIKWIGGKVLKSKLARVCLSFNTEYIEDEVTPASLLVPPPPYEEPEEETGHSHSQ